jgi:aminoglycoside phosphotransferase (APT) family kinase protein
VIVTGTITSRQQWTQTVDLPHDMSSDAFRVSDRRARPSPEALSWAVSSLGDGGKLVSVRPLVGGISSAVHGLVIEDRHGGRSRVVMRRWLEPETGSLVRREAAALTGLAATAIPAPALVAADPSGDNAGCPALLMEWLPGQVDLAPRDPQRWLGALAHVGAQIHEARVEVPPYEYGINLSGLASNSFAWSTRPDAWKHARGLLSGENAPSNDVFLHADFQHFNALWSRRQLSGIVDWTFAAIGPRELDTGRCRLNLAVLSQWTGPKLSVTRTKPKLVWRSTRCGNCVRWRHTDRIGHRSFRCRLETEPASMWPACMRVSTRYS